MIFFALHIFVHMLAKSPNPREMLHEQVPIWILFFQLLFAVFFEIELLCMLVKFSLFFTLQGASRLRKSHATRLLLRCAKVCIKMYILSRFLFPKIMECANYRL